MSQDCHDDDGEAPNNEMKACEPAHLESHKDHVVERARRQQVGLSCRARGAG